ncbi:MAG: GNAT family N-acetyltransferase [Flavobacteriales bacterium]|nr:GNAT family N-acetyltransferase [Flavobacteriales bacterium]
MEVQIQFYEDWMKDQVVSLFVAQYGVTAGEFAVFFERFYEHDFQREKTIRIAAVDGEKVVGFQSFFYWPYKRSGKVYNTFQSGNSLVHPDYRGQGMFQRMLNFVYENEQQLGLDFFVGFPVEASIRSFRKNGWNNLLNLRWYIRPVNVFAPLFLLFSNPAKRLSRVFSSERIVLADEMGGHGFRRAQDAAFSQWRDGYSADEHYYFRYESGEKHVVFEGKFSRRKKVLGELVIGDIATNVDDAAFLTSGMQALLRKARSARIIAFVSCAINDTYEGASSAAIRQMFKPMDREIYFITRNFCGDAAIDDPGQWQLYRSDIDTW